MAGKLAYERYCWFHNQVKNNKHPNSRHLAIKFETSQKTAQRDIEFIRDRISAPLEYSYDNRGYYYTDKSYELPPIWLSENELVAFILAKRLAAAIPDKNIKNSLSAFINKFSSLVSEKACGERSESIGFNLDDLQDKISLKNIEYYSVDENLFRKVVNALFTGKPLEIQYYSPYKNERTRRRILPLHLLDYMGNWHLAAFCALKNEIRNFSLSRISECNYTNDKISLPPNLPQIKNYIRKNFGIFYGGKNYDVSLKFSPKASRTVKEQIWHKKQKIKELKDGSIILKVPVADITEIKRETLKYGAEVEVLKPLRLRKEILEEIKKMKKIYQ
ncbi:MAG: helix-turn-helix transcriptional regulator [Candidatus Scalinduaceae bacterium]